MPSASNPVDGSQSQTQPPAPGVSKALETLRVGLLDVGKRNPLINAPMGKGRGKRIQLEDERSDQIFDILLSQGKRMAFEPSPAGHRRRCGERSSAAAV